jgi:hypothetical protein
MNDLLITDWLNMFPPQQLATIFLDAEQGLPLDWLG